MALQPKLKVDVNHNPTKKGIKVQFVLPQAIEGDAKAAAAQKLQAKLNQGLQQYNLTVSQDTDVPSGQGFDKSLKIDCTTADASPASTDRLQLQQIFEGQNLQYLKKGTANAESLTASFWVKSNKTGTYIVEIRDMDNSRTISKSYTIDASNTWEKKTITFAGDTSGALDNDNAGSIRFNFWLGSGSTYTSGTLATSWQTYSDPDRAVGQVNLADSTSNEWYITGVQLEAGETASDFEFLPVDVNLARCQRYYFKTIEGNANTILMTGGVETSTNAGVGSCNLPVEMRATPTLSFDSGIRFFSSGSSTKTVSVATNRSTPTVLSANVNFGSGGTPGQAGYIYDALSNGNIIGDAEL